MRTRSRSAIEVAFSMKGVEVLLVIAFVCVGGAIVAHSTLDEQPVDFEIVIDGEGTVEPVQGTYSVAKDTVVTLDMQSAEGWLLSIVTIGDDTYEFGTHSGTLDIVMDSDKTIVVHFISPEVEMPETSSYVFDGSEVVAYEDNQFYTVEDGSATDAGTYDARFALRHPDFCHWSDGTAEDKVVTWNIDPKQISADDFQPVGDVVYTGKQVAPVPVPIAPLTTDDFTVTYGDNKDVGTGTIDIVGKNNFTGNAVIEFNILKKALTLSTFVDDDDNEITYGDDAPDYGYDIDGFVDGENESLLGLVVDVSCDYSKNTDVGTYEIVASDVSHNNYDVTHNHGVLVVKKADYVMSGVQFEDRSYEYDGTMKDIRVSGTLPTGIDSKQVSVSYSVGSKDVVDRKPIIATFATDSGNYNVPAPMTAYLTVYHKEVIVTADSKEMVYGDVEPILSATISGLISGDSEDLIAYTLSRASGTDVDQYTISVNIENEKQGNYVVRGVPGQFVVTHRSVTFTSSDATKVYDGSVLMCDDVTVGGKGIATGDAVEFYDFATLDICGSVENTFSYRFTEGKSSNYSISVVPGELTITKDTHTIVVKADSITKMYDGEELKGGTYTYSGNIALGDTLVVEFANGCTITDVGSVENDIVDVKVMRGNTNVTSSYEIAEPIDGMLTVTKRNVVIVSDSGTFVFDGSPHKVESYKVFADGFVEGEGVTLTYTKNRVDVGSAPNEFGYTFDDGTSSDNYVVQTSYGTITVTAKELKVLVLENKEKIYGNIDPIFEGKVTDIDGSPIMNAGITYTFTREQGEGVGTYKVSPTGVSEQGNYKIIYVADSGTLSIKKAELTITADDKVKTYGDADPQFSATASGLRFDDSISVVGTFSFSRGGGENVRTYVITVTGASSVNNYDVTYVTGTLTINKATVTVSADSKTKVYGDANPELTFTASALKYTDSESVLNIVLTTDCDSNSDVGSYPIGISSTVAPENYVVTYVNGTLSVTPATVTVTANDTSKVYGDADPPAFAVTVSGLKGNDTQSDIICSVTRVAGEVVGSYAITATGDADQGNYHVVYVPGTFSITPRGIDDVSIMLATGDSVYNGSVQTKTVTVTFGTTTLVDGVDYRVVGDSAVNAGTYNMTVYGMGNFGGSKVLEWSIGKYTLTPDDFAHIQPMVYIGAQIKPDVTFSATSVADDHGIVIDRDCVLEYGPNNTIGTDAGSVKVLSKGNVTIDGIGDEEYVVLTFDIYTSLSVYVTKDGKGNTYAPDTQRLSDFNSTNTLFDTSGHISAGYSQTAEMYVDHNSGLSGAKIGLLVKELILSDESVNELHDKMFLKIWVDGSSTPIEKSISEASNGVIELCTMDSGDVPIEVEFMLPSDAEGEGVSGKTLSFKLVVCVIH